MTYAPPVAPEVDPVRPWRIATWAMLAIVGALLLLLVATGVYLSYRYRPDPAPELGSANVSRLPRDVRDVHRAASSLFLVAGVGLAVSGAGLAVAGRRRAWSIPAIAVLLFSLAASFTGFLLPWDQLALRTVTVGESISGYRAILSDPHIKYVLLGSREIDPSTLARWFWMHVAVLPVLLVIAFVLAAVGTRAKRRAQE